MKSDNVKSGMQQAPHRSLFNALGFTEEEMKKPMAVSYTHLPEIVAEAKKVLDKVGEKYGHSFTYQDILCLLYTSRCV